MDEAWKVKDHRLYFTSPLSLSFSLSLSNARMRKGTILEVRETWWVNHGEEREMTAEEDEMDIKAKPIGRNFVEESMNAELKIYFGVCKFYFFFFFLSFS